MEIERKKPPPKPKKLEKVGHVVTKDTRIVGKAHARESFVSSRAVL
jgi:hypothetical protein